MRPDTAGSPRRRPAIAVTDITGLRFLPDRAPASPVNISPTGLLAECSTSLRVGSDIAVLFEGRFEPDTITGRVARCEVAVMGPDGLLRYLIGVEFDSALDVGGDAMQRTAPPDAGHVKNRW